MGNIKGKGVASHMVLVLPSQKIIMHYDFDSD